MGCSQDHFAPLKNRVKDDWIRQKPGEFITVSDNLRKHFRNLKPGFVDYWVEYTPPDVKQVELLELQRTGYVVPTKKVITISQTLRIH